ncbi:Ig-like domain-containing protein [Geomonas oryzae]|uniref:Ig-like domain-containing protein n=1 Tax=Geomonas oryzae TaxID=2364273 RepID=UPI00100A55CA|nr:Ig-like domain-containing protein [Geomonas oryzae]
MFRLICAAVAILLLSSCGTETPTRQNDFTPLTSIQIVAAAPSIAVNTSTKLTVIGNFSGLFTRDVTSQAIWSSTAPAVANFVTPTSPSRVTGLAPGPAVLTATVGGQSATFNLMVTSATVSLITITPATPSVPLGQNVQFTATGTFSDGTTQDLTFDATWTSSDATVATVGDTATDEGLAKTLKAGTSTISAAFQTASNSTLMTVTAPVLQSIAVTPANPKALSASTEQFTATGTYSNGTSADITSQVIWSSSQTGIATIAATGKVTTLTQGATVISAALNGVTGNSNLKVTGGNLTGITVTPANPRLVLGTTVQLSANGFFSNGSSRDITGVVGWSVGSPTVGSVSTPGGGVALLTANAVTAAPTTLTATFNAVTGNINLTVAAPLLQSLAIFPASLDLAVGTTGRFTATATFSDGTQQDVTLNANWTASAAGIATVDNTGIVKGRVHGVASGSATVNAAYGGLSAPTAAMMTVRARTLTALTVTPSPATIAIGNPVAFTATAVYSDGTSQNVTEIATWTIDNLNIAAFADSTNQPGQVVGIDTSTAVLTASFGGKSQTVNITVH